MNEASCDCGRRGNPNNVWDGHHPNCAYVVMKAKTEQATVRADMHQAWKESFKAFREKRAMGILTPDEIDEWKQSLFEDARNPTPSLNIEGLKGVVAGEESEEKKTPTLQAQRFINVDPSEFDTVEESGASPEK